MEKCNLAKHSPSHCLAPGLFRSLKKGERKSYKLDVVYEYKNMRIEFSGPEPLGADDLRVLQGLIAMAGAEGSLLTNEPTTNEGKELRESLEPRWDAVQDCALVVKGSFGELAREIGYANPEYTITMRKCIERLWKVSIIAQKGSERRGFRLLSQYACNDSNGQIYVALNPIIALAVIGTGKYVRINMDEVRSLKSDAARLIHQRLCAWINCGKLGRIEIDKLCEYAWPTKATPSTMRKRRQLVRNALKELLAIGWSVKEYAKGKVEIKRPA